MIITTLQINEWIGSVIWPAIRLGAMVMAMPVFGARFVSMKVRAAMVVALTVFLVPIVPTPAAVDLLSAAAVMVAIQQVIIGMAMGFVLQLVFGAVTFGAQGIAMSMGLGFASMIDPQNGVQVPVLAQFYLILTTLLFLAFNGHILAIDLLAESFTTLPVGIDGLSTNEIWLMLTWTAKAFSVGFLIAFPAIAALLLVNLGFGVITRTAPQLNIFAVGFPATLTLGFLIILASMPNLVPQFADLLDQGFGLIRMMISGGQ